MKRLINWRDCSFKCVRLLLQMCYSHTLKRQKDMYYLAELFSTNSQDHTILERIQCTPFDRHLFSLTLG